MSSDHQNGNVTGNGAQMEQVLRASELRYRRLFETAQDGILILDAETGCVNDVNPFLIKLLGFSHGEMVGKTVGELSPFKDIVHNQAMLARLQKDGYIRYHDLPLETKAGRTVAVEFVSNVYQVGDEKVIQCNIREITERKRAEEALRTSQLMLGDIINALPARVFWKDRNLVYLGCNTAFARDAGFADPKDIIGKNDNQMVWREQAEAYRSDDRHVIESGQPKLLIEESQTTPAGKTITLLSSKLPLRDASGEIIGMIGTYLDITARKEAEAGLKEAVDRFQFVTRATNEAVWDWNLTDPAWWNDVFYEVYGFDRNALPSVESWASHIHPDDQERVMSRFRAAVEHGEAMWTDEFRFRRADGTYGHVFDRAYGFRDTSGKIVRMIGSMIDITARKQAEESQARLAMAVEQATESVVITDIHGAILYVNPAFEKSSGYTRAEALGQNSRLLKSGKQDAGFYRQMWDALGRGETWRGQFINKRKDGNLYQEEATISPVRDASGQVVNFVAVKRDVTREVELEEQFRQSQKMEAVGALASGVAHDFNNILGIIMGYGEFLMSGLEPDSQLRKYAGEIQHAAERAAGLTKQLLIFSRKQKVEPVVLDLNDTMKDLEKMLRRLIGENIEMVVVPGKEIGRIKADAGYIGQVLMNLAVNARDAMPIGGKLTIATSNVTLDKNHPPGGASGGASPGQIDLAGLPPAGSPAQPGKRTGAGIMPGDYVLLTVSDTGTGMTPEVKARMFEPLFTTKPVGKGTGLGLPTCRTIVQQSGGHIEVDSEVGKGTTFRIYFPRVDKPVDAEAGSNLTGPMPRGTETLLLVEDEPPVRHLAWHLLESLGYQVLRANNGQDALHLVHEYKGPPIRLVVTDVIMPRMGGMVMADWLKATYPGIKILFTSGYTDDAIGKQGALEPGVAFLAKPYTSAALARKVRAMLDDETETSMLRKLKTTVNQTNDQPNQQP